MFPGQPSRTMLRSAIRRAAHQLLDDPLIFDDPIVVDLVPEASEPAIRDTLDEPGAPEAKLFRCMFAMRSRFAEDRLAQAASRGMRTSMCKRRELWPQENPQWPVMRAVNCTLSPS